MRLCTSSEMSLMEKRAKVNAHLFLRGHPLKIEVCDRNVRIGFRVHSISQIRSDTVPICDGHALLHVVLRLDLAGSTW